MKKRFEKYIVLKRNVVCEGKIENSSLLLLLELERLPFQFPTVKLLYGLYIYRPFTVLLVKTVCTVYDLQYVALFLSNNLSTSCEEIPASSCS